MIELLHCDNTTFGELDDTRSLEFLCGLARGAQEIFEFGTFTGRTALNLAHNTNAHITTLDIACDPERDEYPPYVTGELFKDSVYASRITQLWGDSKTLDLSALYGKMDLVYVDGSHSYLGCRSDTGKAFKLVKRGGIIAWDDAFKNWQGVNQVINELSFITDLQMSCGLIYWRKY